MILSHRGPKNTWSSPYWWEKPVNNKPQAPGARPARTWTGGALDQCHSSWHVVWKGDWSLLELCAPTKGLPWLPRGLQRFGWSAPPWQHQLWHDKKPTNDYGSPATRIPNVGTWQWRVTGLYPLEGSNSPTRATIDAPTRKRDLQGLPEPCSKFGGSGSIELFFQPRRFRKVFMRPGAVLMTPLSPSLGV